MQLLGDFIGCDGTDPAQFIADGQLIVSPSPMDHTDYVLNVPHTITFSGELMGPTPADTEMIVTVYRVNGTTTPCVEYGVGNVALQKLS